MSTSKIAAPPPTGLAPKNIGGTSVCFDTLILQHFINASYYANGAMLLTEDKWNAPTLEHVLPQKRSQKIFIFALV